MSRVLKVFFEEPVALEALVPDHDPDARRGEHPEVSLEALLISPPYARLYVAGTDLSRHDSEGGPLVGLTTLPKASFVPLLEALLGPMLWYRRDEGVGVLEVGEMDWMPGAVAVSGKGAPPSPLLAALESTPTRHSLPALRALLNAGYIVGYGEPAHHGTDLALFFPRRAVHQVRESMERLCPSGERWFLAPFQRARGEHSFYFERWALDSLPVWVEEPSRSRS